MSEQDNAATFDAPSIEEVSKLFPAYEIHSLIACGGMGAVYYATQLSLDRIVAIKILPREFANDESFRDSFESEAKAMAKLNHPNLIGIYDFGKVGGMFFIVMEYVQGQSLYYHTQGHAVDRQDAIRLILGICEGLAHAHEHGILHRDIKPSNILMDETMSPKIGDFGLAQAMGRGIKDGEQIFGTPGYTAPEVIQPPHTFDQRADVFSIGIMLQELLTGLPPDPDKLLNGDLAVSSPRMSAVIRAAIDPDPKYRTKTIMEFMQALQMVSAAKKRLSPAKHAALGSGSGVLQRPFNGKATKPYVAPSGENSGMIWMLVLLAVVIGVVVVVVSNKRNDQAGAPPENPGVTNTTNTPDPGNETPDDNTDGQDLANPDKAIQSAKTAIKRRFAPDFETYKRDMRQSARDLKTEIGKIAPNAIAALDKNFLSWQSNSYRIPASLPNELSRHSGVDDLHERYVKIQKSAEKNLEERIGLQSGVYVMELQNLIEKMESSGRTGAVNQLEDEIRRAEENEGYFRSILIK
jgi:serine/threonine protein kinase